VNFFHFRSQHEKGGAFQIGIKCIIRSVGQTGIWATVHRTWTGLWHLHGSCQQNSQGLDNQRPRNTGIPLVDSHSETLVQSYPANKTTEMLKLNRKYLRRMAELLAYKNKQNKIRGPSPRASGIEPGPLDLQPGTLTTRPQKRSLSLIIIIYLTLHASA
jgi:hypothetical protein